MSDYWVTTHWPTPATEPGQSRHVFVKVEVEMPEKDRPPLPRSGDFIFFRESKTAVVNGTKVNRVTRHHRGIKKSFEVPPGAGGIIGTATVDGSLRKQCPEDVVFNFGDLHEWNVIPCRDFQPSTVPLGNVGDKPASKTLRGILGVDGVIFLNLWKIPNPSLESKLREALRR